MSETTYDVVESAIDAVRSDYDATWGELAVGHLAQWLQPAAGPGGAGPVSERFGR